jgi:hypothetical protein
MMYIGSNPEIVQPIVPIHSEKLGTQPNSAEWCFSNRMMHSFYDEDSWIRSWTGDRRDMASIVDASNGGGG